MNISSNRLGLFALFARCLIAACALMVVGSMRMPAQTASSHARHPSGWEEHFGSAQAAEKSQDYSTAEREYKAVLASPQARFCRGPHESSPCLSASGPQSLGDDGV